jgi:hypothetical protein
MSSNSAAWYVSKARECEELASNATSREVRERYENEARVWREIAADIARKAT